jgi:hypothetical protein
VPIQVNNKPLGLFLLDFTKNSTVTVQSGVQLAAISQMIYYPFQQTTEHIDYNATVGKVSKTVTCYDMPNVTPIALYLDVIGTAVVFWYFRRATHI